MNNETENSVLAVVFFTSIMLMIVFYGTQIENEVRYHDLETAWLHHKIKVVFGMISIAVILRTAYKLSK